MASNRLPTARQPRFDPQLGGMDRALHDAGDAGDQASESDSAMMQVEVPITFTTSPRLAAGADRVPMRIQRAHGNGNAGLEAQPRWPIPPTSRRRWRAEVR